MKNRMTMKTADGIEITKGMKVWVSPPFETGDSENIEVLKRNMGEHIVSSIPFRLYGEQVYLKKGESEKVRYSYPPKYVYANKKKALEERIDVLRGIVSEKRNNLNEEIKKVNAEIDVIQDLKNDLDEELL